MFHMRWIAIASFFACTINVALANEPIEEPIEEPIVENGLHDNAIEFLLEDGAIPERWRAHDVEGPALRIASWSPGMRGVDFEDRSAYAQVSKIRSLSLLTLGQFGQKRLFLGVNREGLLGLHLNAFPHYGDDRYLELARMPYLDEPRDDDEF